MINKLYGDGIHDDTLAIQELLDSGLAEVVLEAPQSAYLIRKTLKIHAGQTLRMSPTTVIRLAPESDCCMIEDDNFAEWKQDICIDGGIWDMNNTAQSPNPYHVPGKDGETTYDRLGIPRGTPPGLFADGTQRPHFEDIYMGIAMRFCHVRNFTLKNITFRNPVIYAVQMGHVENFTVRDINFEYTTCNPKWWNMDGIHLEGGCRNGCITNLKGAVHDDMVALTSDDGLYGLIENVVIDGLYAEQAHSAVRLLSHGVPVKNVHIRNVFGSYYVYCVGLTKYFGGPEERGKMSNISIENVSACASEGTADVHGGGYPFLWVDGGIDVDGLRIENVYREEETYPTPLLKVEKTSHIERLQLRNIVQRNLLDEPVPFLVIDGEAPDADITLTKEI